MNRKPHGRIEEHMQESGGPTPEALEKRAREIAMIEGREDGVPNEADREQARRELFNEHIDLSSQNRSEEPMQTEEGSHLAADTGHRTPDHKPEDSQLNEEIETREGIREAEHDTMVNERRQPDGDK